MAKVKPKRQIAIRRSRTPKTAMIIRPAPEKPWEISQEQVTILKNTICKGATDAELQFCLTVARRYRLDPFRGQIWFVKRKDNSAEGGYRWIPIVGIDGLLHIAARDHQDFGSYDEPEYGPMKTVAWKYYDKSGTIEAPEWARVKAWKKGLEHPIVATVWWNEIYPEVGAAPLVRRMPRLMLAKCARAQVTRQAYPATDGLYIKEEFQGREQFTAGGREIIYEEDIPATGSHEAAQAVAAEKIAKYKSSLLEKAEAENVSPVTGNESNVLDVTAAPASQTKQESADSEEKAENIELDWTDESSPVVRGDISAILDLLEKQCNAKWGTDSWWHIPPAKSETLRQICRKWKFRLTEVMPKSSAGSMGRPSPSPLAEKPAAEEAKGQPSAGPSLVAGLIEQANPQDKPPRVSVLLMVSEKPKTSVWMTAFDKPHFEPLMKSKGQRAELFITKREKDGKTYTNIVGLKRVGNVEFDEDGKTPVVQQSQREAGGKTLF